MISEHLLSTRKSCAAIELPRSAFYRKTDDPSRRDSEVLQALNGLLERHPRWRFWKCFKSLRKTHVWNHKRVYRVYCHLGLNQKKRTKNGFPNGSNDRSHIHCYRILHGQPISFVIHCKEANASVHLRSVMILTVSFFMSKSIHHSQASDWFVSLKNVIKNEAYLSFTCQ